LCKEQGGSSSKQYAVIIIVIMVVMVVMVVVVTLVACRLNATKEKFNGDIKLIELQGCEILIEEL